MENDPRWSVVTPTAEKHELHFDGKVQSRLSGESGRLQLEDMAALFNRAGKVPQRPVQCAADSKDPEAYQRKLSRKSPLLIPDEIPNETEMKTSNTNEPPAPVVQLIDAMRFRRYPSNRQISDEEASQMAVSVKEVGILQPIMARPVTPEKEGHPDLEIVMGECRWQGASLLDVHYPVPVFIREMDEKEAAKLNAIENFKRKNLDEIQEAKTLQNLKDQGYSIPEIMEIVGCKKDHIYDRLRLLKLDDTAHTAIREGNLSLKTAVMLTTLPEEKRSEALEAVVNPTHAHKALPEREALALLDRVYIEPAKKADEWRERQQAVMDNFPGAKWVEYEEARGFAKHDSGYQRGDDKPWNSLLSDAARSGELVVPTWAELAKKHSAPLVIGCNYGDEAHVYVLVQPIIDAEKAAHEDKPGDCIFIHELAVQQSREDNERRKIEAEQEREALRAEGKRIVELILTPDGIKKTALQKLTETFSLEIMETYSDWLELADILDAGKVDDEIDEDLLKAAIAKYLRSKSFSSPMEAFARLSFAQFFHQQHHSDIFVLFDVGAIKKDAFPAYHKLYLEFQAKQASEQRDAEQAAEVEEHQAEEEEAA